MRAGTSNDLAGQTVTDFAYMYGLMPAGAMVLYVAFAAMLWVWRPPGIPTCEGKTLEPALANRVETQAENAAIIPVTQTNAPR